MIEKGTNLSFSPFSKQPAAAGMILLLLLLLLPEKAQESQKGHNNVVPLQQISCVQFLWTRGTRTQLNKSYFFKPVKLTIVLSETPQTRCILVCNPSSYTDIDNLRKLKIQSKAVREKGGTLTYKPMSAISYYNDNFVENGPTWT